VSIQAPRSIGETPKCKLPIARAVNGPTLQEASRSSKLICPLDPSSPGIVREKVRGLNGLRGLRHQNRRELVVSDDTIALNEEQLEHLARYFNEEVTFSKHIGAKVKEKEVEPGRSIISIDVQDIHLNGAGTLHGGVYASLIDNAMGLSVLALVGVRTATIEMNVHFLGAVSAGRITCESEVLHRSRRTATAEAKVRDLEGNLVALGTGTFRVFESKGNAIV
jgi:uncharacterized protein (TIGR00369 family)